MRTTLENKREAALGFVDVLEDKFTAISQQLLSPKKWARIFGSTTFLFKSHTLVTQHPSGAPQKISCGNTVRKSSFALVRNVGIRTL